MTIITVEIRNNKALKILEGLEDAMLIRLKGTKKMSAEKKRILKGIKSALNEVELHAKGKVKLQTARDFLNEV
ncbi:MAG: hypothetical protein LH473_11390 [Chitinophagales bacterium]|nr:hypothetical protein [Chitinophagales bacterium]